MRVNLRAAGALVIGFIVLLSGQRLVSQGQSVSLTAGGGGTSQLGSPQTVTATLTDGGNPIANVGVSFTIMSGPRTGMGALIHTDSSGQAAWTYTGIGPAGTDVVLAQVAYGGMVHSSSASVTWTLPTFGVSGSGTSQLGSPQTITATLATNGTPAPNAGVSFVIISGPRSGQGAVIHTGPDGRASWTYTGIGPAGSDVIQVSVAFAGIALSATGGLDWTLPDFTLTPSDATISPGTEHTVTATLRTNGLPVPGASVSFRIISGPNTGPGPVVPTNANGQAQWTYTGRVGGFGADTVEAGVAFAGIALSSIVTAMWGGEADLSISQRPIDIDTREELEAVFRTFRFDYELAFNNAGPTDGRDVLVEGTLPLGVSYDEDTCGGSGNGQQWSISIGTLAPSPNRMTCRVRVSVDASATGPLINAVRIGGSTTDPDLTNNARSLSTDIWQLAYYGLGDSVASGHGLDDAPPFGCRRSPTLAYPRRVLSGLSDLTNRYEGVTDAGHFACSGATTTGTTRRDLSSQLQAVLADIPLQRQIRKTVVLVSMTFGANDFPWARPGLIGDFLCAPQGTFVNAVSRINERIVANLRFAIGALLPPEENQLRIIVTEYHNPFNPDSVVFDLVQGPPRWVVPNPNPLLPPLLVVPNPFFNSACRRFSIRELNARTEYAVRQLNAGLSGVVATAPRAGLVAIAPVYAAFQPHKSKSPECGSTFVAETWIQAPFQRPRFSLIDGDDCFHPNSRGAEAFAAAVGQTATALVP